MANGAAVAVHLPHGGRLRGAQFAVVSRAAQLVRNDDALVGTVVAGVAWGTLVGCSQAGQVVVGSHWTQVTWKEGRGGRGGGERGS